MTNLPATLSTLNQEIGVLTDRLQQVPEDVVAKSVRSLLAAGLALPSGMQADRAPEIYAYALSGVSTFGVSRATQKIIRGEYEINRGFVPTPPEFAAMARLETRQLVDDLVRLKDRKAAIENANAPREKTDERQLARIKELHIGFRAFQLATSAQKPDATHEPMNADQAEYWAKIATFKDTDNEMSAEQIAFRRKIAADLAEVKPDDAARDVA